MTSTSGSPEGRISEPATRVPLWRNRDYMLLWVGQVTSTLGSSSVSKVYPLLILALTGSAAQAGIAGALQALPYLILSLPAGALVDRWDRKRVMMLCDVGRGIGVGSIALALAFDALSIWQIYAVALVNGSLFVFFNVAEATALPKVVPPSQLTQAVGQNEAAFGAAMIAGPTLGTSLFQMVSRSSPFAVNTISFFISMVSLLLIRTPFRAKAPDRQRKLVEEIREGLAWIWNRPLIRYLAFLCGCVNMTFAATPLLLIVLAKQLGAQDAQIGILFSIGGIGGILGSVFAARIHKRFGFWKVVAGGVSLIALLFPIYAMAPNVIVLGLLFGVIYMTYSLYSVVQYAYRLALIPDALQGRVNSSFRLIAFGFDPLGALLTGLIIEYVGVMYAVGFISLWLAVVAITALVSPSLRSAPPMEGSHGG